MLFNEDGTPYMPPENPLMEKWRRKYPRVRDESKAQLCDGFTCMYCNRCPDGGHWKIPKEDEEAYLKYTEELQEYIRIHSPFLYQIISGQENPE